MPTWLNTYYISLTFLFILIHILLIFCYEDDKDDGKAICELAPDEGNCEAYAELFFYNSTSKACEEFIYGGCGGNGNRFYSEKECYKKCGDKGELLTCVEVRV